MRCMTDAAPVQYEGLLDDYHSFYFRARGNWVIVSHCEFTRGAAVRADGHLRNGPIRREQHALTEAERLIRDCSIE